MSVSPEIVWGAVRRRLLGERPIHGRGILRAAAIIGILTLVGRVLGIFAASMMAGAFGTGNSMDAYLVAIAVPSYAINTVAASFNAALIPVYIEARERNGIEAAHRLFASVCAATVVLLLAISVVLALLGPVLIPALAGSFGPQKLMLARVLFYLMVPTILLNGLATNWGAVLNAGERFALAALAPNVIVVLQIAYLRYGVAHLGIYGLTYTWVAGYLTQLCILGWALRRLGIPVVPRWRGLTPEMRKVLKQYAPLVAAASIMGGTSIVDQAMAAHLGAGNLAILNYGGRMIAFAMAITVAALGTAVLPYFSQMVAESDWTGLRRILRVYSLLILAGAGSLALLLCACSGLIVRIVYQHGHFTSADAAVVSQVQIMYLLQLPFYTIGILYVRTISALQASHILIIGTIISFTLNVSLDWLLMRYLGPRGIALSTTLVYVVSSGYLLVMLRRRLTYLERSVAACA